VVAELSPSIIVHVERVVGVGVARDDAPDPFIATIELRVEPGPPGSGRTFALEFNTGTLPPAFYKAVEEAALRTLSEGLYGWEVIDCVVSMTEGILHRDWATSTAADHRKLAPLTVMSALRRAGTEVHEPVQAFHLECPPDSLGSFVGIIPEYGEITSEPLITGPTCIVEGEVRAAKVADLQGLIPGLTRGEGFRRPSSATTPGCRVRSLTRPGPTSTPELEDYLRQVTWTPSLTEQTRSQPW
jgi:ribosomal protection tetracycline resistance protein